MPSVEHSGPKREVSSSSSRIHGTVPITCRLCKALNPRIKFSHKCWTGGEESGQGAMKEADQKPAAGEENPDQFPINFTVGPGRFETRGCNEAKSVRTPNHLLVAITFYTPVRQVPRRRPSTTTLLYLLC